MPRACAIPSASDEAQGIFSTDRSRSGSLPGRLFSKRAEPVGASARQEYSLADIGLQIDWASHLRELGVGDLSGIGEPLASRIRAVAGHADVVQLAGDLGLDGTLLAIALIAHALPVKDRSAARLLRTIFGGPAPQRAGAIAHRLRVAAR